MLICITSKGENLDSNTDPRFGRCEYFIFYNTEDDSFEAVKNKSAEASGGAGIKAGELLSDKNVEVLITGNVGPNAFDVLSAAEIKIAVKSSGSVKDAIAKFKNGEVQFADAATVKSHSGMKEHY
jgi:predicted Fe-Mo cluster-binding NifX family protein